MSVFSLLSHMSLVDDVAGVVPTPSPSIGETWMEPLGISVYKVLCFQGAQRLAFTLTTPPNNFSLFVGRLGNSVLYSLYD